MMPDSTLEDYILAHTTPEEPWMAETYKETWRYRLYPRMCAGHLQGSILTMLTRMIAPKRALELGTYSGYSSMAIASGMPADGHLHTVEIDDEHEAFILRQIERSPLASRITLHIGDALTIVPAITDEPWDMVYIDANKRDYTAYYKMARELTRPGGYILADNTLWDGKVINPEAAIHDPQCRGIMEFNDMVAADTGVETAILPLRDGLTIIHIKE